jgi:hypothetical protein
MTEMRGSAPAAQCLDQWATAAPSDAPTQTPAEETSAEAMKPLLQESFATALAFAALALSA